MTAQFRESIKIDGKEYGMASEPLESLIAKEFSGSKEGFPEGYPVLAMTCTANWRGYIGYWVIEDNQLWLVDVKSGDLVDGDDNIYVEVAQNEFKRLDWRKTLFNHQQGNIKADWFTGQLVIEMGELIEYVHMGYSSQYEKYTLIDIEKGNVISKKTLSGEEYRPNHDYSDLITNHKKNN